ncbi:hypothetical protein [Nocardiopsis sp. CC223A]|uniref:hypothetical protein n=1 Tax=Nocardiopsis sp. CC223A TaxID=3044051 RepID=UPI00278BD006|nr:hypothetical protein [Nocardiopsis sp. CC223A]
MAEKHRDYLPWELFDRDRDPIPWVVSDVRELEGFYKRLAESAQNAARDLRRLDGGELGEGKTVDTLKEFIEELPKYLDKAHDAYDGGYRALHKWGDALEIARERSATVARMAETAYAGLEDEDDWKDGDDPLRDVYIARLDKILTDMDEVVDAAKQELEDAKQGSPKKLWGWLDKIVTWVEENPLIYAVVMVAAGLVAIFVPFIGVALVLAALAVSTASLHREGKLGFNRETFVTLGMDAISLVPGGALLRGVGSVGRVAARGANRVAGPTTARLRSAATAVRNGSGVTRVSTAITRIKEGPRAGAISYAVARDTAVGMGSSIAVQLGAGTADWKDINLGHEFLGAFGTNAAGSTAGVLRERGDFGGPLSFLNAPSGGSNTSSDPGGVDYTYTQTDYDRGGADPSGSADPAPDGPDLPTAGSTRPGDDSIDLGTVDLTPNGGGHTSPDPQSGGDPSSAPAPARADAPEPRGGDASTVPASPRGEDPSSAPAPARADAPESRGGDASTVPASPRGEDPSFAPAPARSDAPQPRGDDPFTVPAATRGGDADGEGAPSVRSDTPAPPGEDVSATPATMRDDGPEPTTVPEPVRGDSDGTPAPQRDDTDGSGAADNDPATPGDGRPAPFTMRVTPDNVTIGDTAVRVGDGGFRVEGADGSSVSTTDGLTLTGPDGAPGPSLRGDDLTVPTADGDVTVSRGPDGSTIRTEDGLSVHRPGDGEPVRITQDPRDPVDIEFAGPGPSISRPAADGTGPAPRTRVDDPAGGTRTEAGPDGYRVEGEGSTHTYDRGSDSVSVDSGGVRIDAEPGSVRVTDPDRGVDVQQWDNGTAVGRGAGSGAMVRQDGSIDLRTGNATLSPRATQDAGGHVRIDGDGGIGGSDAWPGQVRTEDGTGMAIIRRDGEDRLQVWHPDGTRRSYGMDGGPIPAGAHPPLRTDSRGEPYVLSGGTRISVTRGSDTSPALRMDTPQGWTVTTSRDGETTLAAPSDGGGDRFQVTRRPDGTTEVGTDTHRVRTDADGLTARGPGGVRGGSDRDGSHVTDGTTRTDVRRGESSGLGRADTVRADRPGRPLVSQGDARTRVETDDGIGVDVRGDRVEVRVPTDGDRRTVRNGDRVVDTGPDGTSVRPTQDGPRAGGPDRWHATIDDRGGVSGGSGRDQNISVRPRGEAGRLPHRPSDEVSFTSGDLQGTRTPSGRTEVRDGEITIADGRGGVRVDGGEGRPELRITEDQVHVTEPDGHREVIDVNDIGRTRTDRNVPVDPARGPVLPPTNTVRHRMEEMAWQVSKNIINLTFGLGLDGFREAFGILDEYVEIEKGYWVQNAMQLATAVPKGGYEGRVAGTPGLPTDGLSGEMAGVVLEMSHQATRNNLKDEYLEEREPTYLRLEEIEDQLGVLDAMLDDRAVEEYEAENGPLTPEQRRTLDELHKEARLEQGRLRREQAELQERENG